MMSIDTNSTRSYATRELLVGALTKRNLVGFNHVVVRNEAGRYTAIFQAGGLPVPGGAFHIASQGFMVLG